VNDRRKDFMINHNESDLRRPEIEPGSPDSPSKALPIELTGRLDIYNYKIWPFLQVYRLPWANQYGDFNTTW
jgi:hypothetical protein